MSEQPSWRFCLDFEHGTVSRVSPQEAESICLDCIRARRLLPLFEANQQGNSAYRKGYLQYFSKETENGALGHLGIALYPKSEALGFLSLAKSYSPEAYATACRVVAEALGKESEPLIAKANYDNVPEDIRRFWKDARYSRDHYLKYPLRRRDINRACSFREPCFDFDTGKVSWIMQDNYGWNCAAKAESLGQKQLFWRSANALEMKQQLFWKHEDIDGLLQKTGEQFFDPMRRTWVHPEMASYGYAMMKPGEALVLAQYLPTDRRDVLTKNILSQWENFAHYDCIRQSQEASVRQSPREAMQEAARSSADSIKFAVNGWRHIEKDRAAARAAAEKSSLER